MGQNVPLCDSPYSLPHLIVARLLGEVMLSFLVNDRLEELSESGSTDCVMFCNGEAFYNLLDENQKPHWVYLMLKIIRDALQADQTLESYKGNLKVALLQDHTTFLEEVGL